MASDAKLGLVLGVAIVLIVAIVFFRGEAPSAKTEPNPPAAAQASDPMPTSLIVGHR